MTKELTLGFSPCPNDTFMFYPLVHGLVDTEGLSYRERLEDVETLNRLALAGELDVNVLEELYTYLIAENTMCNAPPHPAFGHLLPQGEGLGKATHIAEIS